MVALPASFDNVAAASFFDAARTFGLDADVTLDGGAVTKLSTLAIQVLISLDISLQQHGHKLLISNPSKEMHEVMQDVGLQDVFKRWSAV